jgi:spore coat protein CotH
MHVASNGRVETVDLVEAPPASGAAAASPPERIARTFRGKLRPRAAGSVLRYWFTADVASGALLRLPHSDAPAPAYLILVDAPIASRLPVYRLQVSPAALAAMDNNPFSNELHPALFFDGARGVEAQIRYRGAWGRNWAKKPIKVILANGAEHRGRRRFNLNSAYRDESFLREPLAYEVYRLAGAPSLESRLVRVQMNDEFWGLFVEVEQPKKSYLRELGMRGGLLFKAASRAARADERALPLVEALARDYTVEVGDPGDLGQLWRFTRALEESTNVAEFFADRMNVEAYINYACATVLVQNWDGFNKNHFLAADRGGAGKWTVVPWDLDRTFGDHWSQRFDVATTSHLLGTRRFPGTTGYNRLLDRFLSEPDLRHAFEARLRQLLAQEFTPAKIGARIDALQSEIAPEARLDRARWGGSSWTQAVERVRRFVSDRHAFLLHELPGGEPEKPRSAAPDDGARLDASPWRSASSAPRPAGWHRQRPERAGRSVASPGRGRRRSSTKSRRARSSAGSCRKACCYRRRCTPGARRASPRTANRRRGARRADSRREISLSSQRRSTSRARSTKTSSRAPEVGARREAPVDDRGGVLIVDGFDGTARTNPDAQGVPRDGVLGVHRLGPYRGRNVLQLTSRDTEPVRLTAPPGACSFLRFVVTGGGGDSTLPLTIVFDDGTELTAELPCDDWYDDYPPDDPAGSVRPGSVPILNTLDRIRAGQWKDRNEPALFEFTLAIEPPRAVREVVLRPAGAKFQQPDTTRFNLFAVTAIRVP